MNYNALRSAKQLAIIDSAWAGLSWRSRTLIRLIVERELQRSQAIRDALGLLILALKIDPVMVVTRIALTTVVLILAVDGVDDGLEAFLVAGCLSVILMTCMPTKASDNHF